MSTVTTHYLEMRSAESLKPCALAPGLSIVEVEIKNFRLNKFLYQLVGENWQWRDKLALADTEWQAFAERDALRTWVAYHRGAIAGYFELEQQAEGNTEIVYFGLAPAFIGMGFGGALLSAALEAAWQWRGTQRVWVHTCSLDHPNALNNYTARGLQICREIVE